MSDDAKLGRAVKRNRQRADRINEKVDIGGLLSGYGYEVIPDETREQQYRCDLHGYDNKPSARYYPSSNSTYCFACGRSRGVVDLVMDKEGLTFTQALDSLEERFRLPVLPWQDEEKSSDTAVTEIEAILAAGDPFEEVFGSLNRFLDMIIHDRALPISSILKFTEAMDRISYGISKESWDETKGKIAVAKLKAAVMQELREPTRKADVEPS